MTTSNAESNGQEFSDELQSLARKHWLLEGKKKLPKFKTNVDTFPELFRRVLAMTSVTTMSFTMRRLLLAFVVHAFQSLDVAFVKKELATLVQIHIWAGLSSEERRNAEFEKHPPLRKI